LAHRAATLLQIETRQDNATVAEAGDDDGVARDCADVVEVGNHGDAPGNFG
jgi:hypothetical protein